MMNLIQLVCSISILKKLYAKSEEYWKTVITELYCYEFSHLFLIVLSQTALFHMWVALKNPIRMILNNL